VQLTRPYSGLVADPHVRGEIEIIMPDLPTTIQIACIALTTIATIVLAFLTGRYVRLTHSMVEEAKSQKEPNVWIDLELSSYQAKLLVGNSGTSPAKNLKFEVKDNIPWRKDQNFTESLETIHPVMNGISYLAPARTLKYVAGYIDNKKTFSELESTVEIKLTYETEAGKKIIRDFVIDIGQYYGVLFESFTNPASEIARAIKDIERTQKSDHGIDKIASRFFKKNCPVCGELINSSAKKCPQCLEFLPEKEKTGEETSNQTNSADANKRMAD
jgi:hypothetical protein